jgi:hypothetical protein
MKTDDLIAMLGTNVEPVDRRQVMRTVAIAIAVAAVVALGAMLLLFGVRADLHATTDALAFLLLKLVFTTALIIPASIYLVRLSRPGGERKTPMALVAAPFVVIMLLAAINLVFAPISYWDDMIIGDRWLECLLSIPVIAIVPFAVIIWALRRMAPTDLVRAGALGGLVAGAVSATGYALHCSDDSLPFVALWYGGTIAICAAAGALLGPRLLRW